MRELYCILMSLRQKLREQSENVLEYFCEDCDGRLDYVLDI